MNPLRVCLITTRTKLLVFQYPLRVYRKVFYHENDSSGLTRNGLSVILRTHLSH